MKTVKTWTAESTQCLRGCFDWTDWQMFYDSTSDLNKLVRMISSYVAYCVDVLIPTKQITVFPNNQPWVTKDLKDVLSKKKRVVFFQGSAYEKKQVNKEVTLAVRKTMNLHRTEIESKLKSGSLRDAWKNTTRLLLMQQLM